MDTNIEDPKKPQASARRGVPRWMVIVAFSILLVFLAVIGGSMRREQTGSIEIGQVVPDFSIVPYTGEPYNFSELMGKVIVVNFWASWCDPCAQEAAPLEQAWRYYQPSGEVAFLGIAYTDTEPAALSYLEEYDITYSNAPDLQMRISQMFRITGVPETYFIDREGRLVYVKKGPFTSLGEFQAVIEGLLE
jgi:cytochrome c biogenesis protein CcmG/thiol:disulfide interchange protein DsbE